MARGWESKSVESQIEDRDHQQPRDGSRKPIEDIEREQRRESLENARRSVKRDLEATNSPLRRTVLEHALKHLDEQLRKEK